MFGLSLKKLWHKKWMNISLLVGSLLLVGTLVSFPVYKSAAFNKMIVDEFSNYIETDGAWPAYFHIQASSRKEPGGETMTRLENLMPKLYEDFDVTERNTIIYYYLLAADAHSTSSRDDSKVLNFSLCTMSGLEDHASMIAGEMYSDDGLTDDGAIEVVVSQSTLVNESFLIGETIEFDNLNDVSGNPIRVYIKGVFDKADSSDLYWVNKPSNLRSNVLMNTELFKQMFTGDNAGKYNITCNYYAQFEYESIDEKQVDAFIAKDDYYKNESAYRSVLQETPYRELLDDYLEKKGRISETLIILQVPVLVMLAAFLLMISGQMYELEKNEISVIKSRGSSRAQIFRLYLYQGSFITLLGALGGIPLGLFLARVLGATGNFLEFDFTNYLNVNLTKEGLLYALLGIVMCLLCITLPAIKHSKVTIVNLKQSKAVGKKPLWQKLFLDVILLLVSLYGYYSFNKNANISVSVSSGEGLDPLLYISSSLFILGGGLLFLRIQPELIRLIYIIGKKLWKPASYVSFMDNIKNSRKQQLIMLFMILTVSLGMYSATVARTILDNGIRNTEYIDGADVIVKEVWKVLTDENNASTGEYLVPDYNKYAAMDIASKYTRVIDDTAAYVYSGEKNDRQVCTLLGIHTKEFGETTSLEKGLNEKQYYSYLNDLAVKEGGVLVSSSFATILGYKVGDTLNYYNSGSKALSGTIVGFFDYFPGYIPSETAVNADGSAYTKDNFMIVTHYDYLVNKLGTTPYEVWIKLNDGVTDTDVYNWFDEHDVELSKYVNRLTDLDKTKNDPLLQGTNGILTLSFVVTMVLCAIGYLIYWVMSIKERELMFGVLRAMGLHKGEIIHLLINEQIYCGLFSVLAGAVVGKITSILYVPILEEAFASRTQALPMKLITNPTDMVRLSLFVGGVMLIALLVLLVLVSKMNVTKALKLGEE